jgi:hypothetical protein
MEGNKKHYSLLGDILDQEGSKKNTSATHSDCTVISTDHSKFKLDMDNDFTDFVSSNHSVQEPQKLSEHRSESFSHNVVVESINLFYSTVVSFRLLCTKLYTFPIFSIAVLFFLLYSSIVVHQRLYLVEELLSKTIAGTKSSELINTGSHRLGNLKQASTLPNMCTHNNHRLKHAMCGAPIFSFLECEWCERAWNTLEESQRSKIYDHMFAEYLNQLSLHASS